MKSVRTRIEELISEVERSRSEDSTFGSSGRVAMAELKGYLDCAVDTDAIFKFEREAYMNRVNFDRH